MRTLPISLLSVLLLSAAALFPERGGAQDIETEGRVIDIRPVTRGAEVYPMNKKARFGKSIPEKYVGKRYAVSLVELEGPKRVRAGRKCRITVALPREDAASPVWRPTGETFFVRSLRHYLYACDYDTPGEWIDLPQAGESSTRPLLPTGPPLSERPPRIRDSRAAGGVRISGSTRTRGSR